MNDSATRPLPSRANAIAIPAAVSVLIASGAAAGRIPLARSPMCRSLPFIGGPAFAICADSTIRTVSPSGFIASATPRSRISGATTSPRPFAGSARRNVLAAAQADAGGVDRLLPERAEPLPLERRVAVAHFAAGEERLQPVVGRAGQQHAAQDLAPLGRRKGGPDRSAAENPSQARTSSSTAWANRVGPLVPGVVSSTSSGS